LIVETCDRLHLTRLAIDDQEILERMVYPMINEGARILEEGIAAPSGDIDVIWLNGYGWPVHRGGPMFYADLASLKTIVERLAFYARSLNEPSLEPTGLSKRLADEESSFSSLKASIQI
jgi:3-hydroxyacyl-CoA dehydrogenase